MGLALLHQWQNHYFLRYRHQCWMLCVLSTINDRRVKSRLVRIADRWGKKNTNTHIRTTDFRGWVRICQYLLYIVWFPLYTYWFVISVPIWNSPHVIFNRVIVCISILYRYTEIGTVNICPINWGKNWISVFVKAFCCIVSHART